METRNYTYATGTWGDLLTNYNGKAISYDAIGNMTSYDGATFTWEGRSLAALSKGGSSYSYQYNADGIRTGKTVNGVTTEYFLNGSQILAQKTGNSAMWFFYDNQGTRTGLVYSDRFYYYLYNVQGDVVALADSANGQLVARYNYDAWGKCTVTNASGYTVGDANPFRYRGYYYDTETEQYYLNSRYYNPSWGRFISADTPAVTTISPESANYNKNLFAYCDNNPVMRRDDGGQFWHLVIGGVVGGIIGGVSAAVSGGDLWDIAIGAVFGAAGGVLSASGAGVLVQAIGSAGIAMASNATTQIKRIASDKAGNTRFNVVDMLFDGAVGLATGYLGGNGASHGNVKGINSSWKQLSKRGLLEKSAREYFKKTAHRAGGDYVIDALKASLKVTAKGSGAIVIKNWIMAS